MVVKDHMLDVDTRNMRKLLLLAFFLLTAFAKSSDLEYLWFLAKVFIFSVLLISVYLSWIAYTLQIMFFKDKLLFVIYLRSDERKQTSDLFGVGLFCYEHNAETE